jgi:tetratricopeptide (TPR) repeat protein
VNDCEVPLFLRDKKYADFRKDPDDGFNDVNSSLLRITNRQTGRSESPDFHTDFALDWKTGKSSGLWYFDWTFVDHGNKIEYCVLTRCQMACNETATEKFYKLGKDEKQAYIRKAFSHVVKHVKKARTKSVPLDWAMTQNNLGIALRTLGERESGTARLDYAITAFRAALEEFARERLPLQWATTQNNLGLVLATLGARESGTARLHEAITAYRAALEERTRERVALDWAMTQNNLGTALKALGEREGSTTRLEEAVTAFRAALMEYTHERAPHQWAIAQNNLAAAEELLAARQT